jgi:hypothetical protein
MPRRRAVPSLILLFALALVLALAAGCGDEGPADVPYCLLSTDRVAFGVVPVGSAATDTVHMVNGGGGTMSGTIHVPDPVFQIEGDTTFSVTEGNFRTIVVRFVPIDAQQHVCTVTLPPYSCSFVAAGTGRTP